MSITVKRTELKKKVKRYEDVEKVKLLNDYQELRDGGKNAIDAAKEVGVPYITLRTWQKVKEVRPRGYKKSVKVHARGATATSKPKTPKPAKQAAFSAAVILVLPDGTRVECANATDAAALIKATR